MLSCIVTCRPIAQKLYFYFEVIVYATIFPCTTTGYIDIVLVVQVTVTGQVVGAGGQLAYSYRTIFCLEVIEW